MDELIRIDKNTQFDYDDLMKNVDRSCEFTLRDVVRACIDSKMSIPVLSNMLHCRYIEDFWYEIQSKPFEGLDGVEHLSVYLSAIKDTTENINLDEQGWFLCGSGKKGCVPQDVLDCHDLTQEEKDNYKERYAVEYSPLYKLSDYVIRIGDTIEYCNYTTNEYKFIDFQPTITLIELLFAVLGDLSDLGSPEQRNKFASELKSTLERRINEDKTYSSEEVFERVMKKIDDTQNSKKEI